jgi:hypothetical protein
MGSTTRRTVRGLAGLVAAASLAVALAVPAFASHEDDFELVPVGTGAGEECEGYDFGFKLDNMDQMSAGVYTASDAAHTVWIEIELFESSEGEVNDYDILDARPAIANIVEKQPNEGGGISHLTFCYNEAEPTPTPVEETPTPVEETPSPTPLGEEPTPTPLGEQPTATPREGTRGGTPAPSGGTVPNTAAQPWTGVPASVLGLVLLASLGALVYVRLAQEPTKR